MSAPRAGTQVCDSRRAASDTKLAVIHPTMAAIDNATATPTDSNLNRPGVFDRINRARRSHIFGAAWLMVADTA